MPYDDTILIGDLPAWLIRLSAFIFGALWGSFFNVAIYRWPRQMSVVTPPSHCPSCGKPVPWYRNLPLFAYLMQGGKAACCGAKLTPRYVVVELLGGLVCLVVAELFVVRVDASEPIGPHTISALLYFFFAGGLIVATFIDIEWMIIPDEITLGGAALGFATLPFRPELDAVDAGLGAGGGYLVVVVLLGWVYERLFGRRGMGEGDAKLLLFIGAFTGWQGVVWAVVGGSFQGLAAAIIAYLSGKKLGVDYFSHEGDDPHNELGPRIASCKSSEKDEAKREPPGEEKKAKPAEPDADQPSGWRAPLPFGPFLALAALEWLLFGDQILELYLGIIEKMLA